MVNWDKIYTNHGIIQHRVDTFVEETLDFLNKCGVKRVYDYRAGTGRNAIFLAEKGLEVITYDPSIPSRKLLDKAISTGIRDKISILKSPLKKTDYVGCAMSICSIHHGNLESVKEGVNNIIMPIASEGIVLFKESSKNDPASEYGLKLEEGTRKEIPYWIDGAIPHHFFSKKELRDLFSQTEIISLKEVIEPIEFFEDNKHYYFELLARKE